MKEVNKKELIEKLKSIQEDFDLYGTEYNFIPESILKLADVLIYLIDNQ